eukprot:CAMPEP_0113846372 /NCGR_PEP_ID=MMETSP0372-20130328/1271_1 /TAXON_ID=340204 /ORGANISM="Lankesteria abbotti" /LENGTH=410 /DNA_ID=CAMNT_0000815509 /DNA_START=330 /DNA_END=1562 /DNA_ORIENTATION=+ /assembly_acc=CAM_ASM_000359
MAAPTAALNVMAYDPFEHKKQNFELEFRPLIIAMESAADKFEERQFIRGLINNNHWFPNIFESLSRSPRLFFVVPYHPKHNDWNARLHAELYGNQDIILVDPHNNDIPINPASLVSPVLRRGLLKILNGHECRFMMLLFGSPPATFVHVRNLFYFLNVASGMALFNKEKSVESFVVSHRLTDNVEEEIQKQTIDDNTFLPNESRISNGRTTVFRGFKEYGKLGETNPQSFVIFSRDNLANVIGATPENGQNSEKPAGNVEKPAGNDEKTAGMLSNFWDDASHGGQSQFVCEFVKSPSTIQEAVERLPPSRQSRSFKIVNSPTTSGIEALTLEAFGFFGTSLGSASLQNLVSTRGIENSCKVLPSTHEPMIQIPTENLVHMNVTAIWDVPCRAAFWQLQSIVEQIPVLFIK